MKINFLLAFFLVSGSVSAADRPLVSVGSDRTFAPKGFDDNDQIQLVIEGRLDSDCYRLEPAEIRLDHQKKQIFIQPKASYYQWLCLEVQVPWTQVINLGHLPSGTWNIKVGSSGESEQLLVKSSTTTRPDDHIYAPVDFLSVDVADGDATATIRGHFPTRCGELLEVIVNDSGKTIEVLPIMAAGTSRNCERMDQPFEHKIQLPKKSKGRYLLHVRSLSGQALNQVYEIQ